MYDSHGQELMARSRGGNFLYVCWLINCSSNKIHDHDITNTFKIEAEAYKRLVDQVNDWINVEYLGM